MSVINGLLKRTFRFKKGLDTGGEFLIACTGRLFMTIGRVITVFYNKSHARRIGKKFRCDDMSYRIKDLRIPPLDKQEEVIVSCGV